MQRKRKPLLGGDGFASLQVEKALGAFAEGGSNLFDLQDVGEDEPHCDERWGFFMRVLDPPMKVWGLIEKMLVWRKCG